MMIVGRLHNIVSYCIGIGTAIHARDDAGFLVALGAALHFFIIVVRYDDGHNI